MNSANRSIQDFAPISRRPFGASTWSRRSFFKCVSVGSAALLAHPTRSASGAALSLRDVLVGPAGLIQPEALAAGEQLLRQALDDLQRRGFPFALQRHSLVSMPLRPELLGMLLHDTRSTPHHDGADIALTIDTRAPERCSLQYVIGRSHSTALEIHSTILHLSGQRREELLLIPRAAGARGPACRADAPQAAQEEGAWYYDRCCAAAWYVSENTGETPLFQLRYEAAAEFRPPAGDAGAPAAYGACEAHQVALHWRDSIVGPLAAA